MPLRRAWLWLLGVAVAALVTLLSPPAEATASGRRGLAELGGAALMLAQVDSLDGKMQGAAKGLFQGVRRSWYQVRWMFGRAAGWWSNWIRRGAFSIGVAVIAALADTGLLNAFRVGGLRALSTYVPLMLFVYLRLLLSGGVSFAPKLLLLGTLVYGAVRRDLLPDHSLVPGRVEDIILIVIATRAFIYSCPEALVNQYADRAVSWRRRVLRYHQRRDG